MAGEVRNRPLSMPRVARDNPAWPAAEAFRYGWESEAARLAAPLAKEGNADALFLMGLTKEAREPARQSRGQAMAYFYRKAGEAGHPEGALRMLLIPLGSNAEADKNEGKLGLEAAAAKNDPVAERLLGEAWLRGFVDGKPDPVKAKEWWEKAAKAGDTTSLGLLGKTYDGTFGFPEITDGKAAREYYQQALRQGDDGALLPLAKLLMGADGPAHDEKEGRELLGRAITKGMPEAYVILGDHELDSAKDRDAAMAAYGKGADAGELRCMHRLAAGLLAAKADDPQGLLWLRKAADKGNPEAAADLGRRLAGGEPAAACRYLTVAAEEGIPAAQYDLAVLHLSGGLGYRDAIAAVAWLTEAMKSGDAESQYLLGTLHEQGIGCPVNYANAGTLYTMACNKGHALAAGRIAFMASEGLGTKKVDLPQAWAYATLAVERGDASSRVLLAALDAKLDSQEKALAAENLGRLKGLSAKPAAGQAGPESIKAGAGTK